MRRKMTGRGTASFILVFALLALPVFAIKVFGHCHDSEPCEKPLQHLISQERWNELGSPETVKYYIDAWLPPGVPNLTTDVPVASSRWSDIQFGGDTVRFRLDYKGLISRGAGFKDGWNVVGWSPMLPPGSVAKATTWYDPAKPKRIIDRFYPSSKTCSDCGNIYKELELRQRSWKCAECGQVLDRDRNASVNILSVGASTLGLGDVRHLSGAITV